MPAHANPSPPLTAVVASLRGGRIRLKVAGGTGVLMVAGVSREALHEELVVGQEIPVRAMGPGGRGETNYSAKGLIKTAWERIAEEYRVGEVVRGRVLKVEDKFALVELLPGAAGFVSVGEMEFDPPDTAREVLAPGEVVSVKILQLSPDAGRGLLSIRQALGHAARERIALVPGGRPFPREPAETGEVARAGAAPAEPGGAVEDRDRLAAENRSLRADLAEVRKELRAAREKAEIPREADPTSSPREFLLAVRIAYARMFEEGDRSGHPLRPMRVGREFLARLRALEGIPVEKVVEVCAQVASGRVKDMPSRKAHRAGEGGSGGAERGSDHARAWRCSLQDNTPGARRLHWWEVPAEGGGVVEFASVGHHDDYDVPG
jgi:hypothetical protein